MQVGSWEEFDQIENFALICSATGAAQVNLIPLYHLGKARIRCVALLHGHSGKASDQLTALQANWPSSWLENFARDPEGLGLSDECIKIIHGNAESVFGQWSDAVNWARNSGLPVLCNLSGGTAQMTAAILLELQEKQVPCFYLTIDKVHSRTRITGRIGNSMQERVLADDEICSFVPWKVLTASKHLKSARTPRKIKELKFQQSNSLQAAQIWRTIHKERARGIAALKLLGARVFNTPRGNPVDAADSEISRIFDQGWEHWNRGILTPLVADFCNGGWLEQYVADEVAKIGLDDEIFDFAAGLEFADERRIRGSDDPLLLGEFDVVVLEGDQPHLVEVKAVTSAGKEAKVQAWLDKLSAWRPVLGGPPTRAWIVSPFLSFPNDQAKKEFLGRAREAGISLYRGADAVKQLCDDLKGLAEARRSD
jgi:hypothetical protein